LVLTIEYTHDVLIHKGS